MNAPKISSIMDETTLTYNDRRVVDLVHQVLNARVNFYQDHKNITELMRLYDKVLTPYTNNDFHKSMKVSQECYDKKTLIEPITKAIHNLIPDNSASFIILPIGAQGHMFAGVIRKKDNEFSLTVINKGARANQPPFKEYTFEFDKLIDSLSKITKDTRPINTIYKTFEKNSTKSYTINVKAKDQKIGNCFIKEPENAIKYAIATSAQSTEILNASRNAEKPIKIKWPKGTGYTHRQFAIEVVHENPKLSAILSKELQKYSDNKVFRTLLELGVDPETSLLNAFDLKNSTAHLSKPERIQECMKHINLDTFLQKSNEIAKLTDCEELAPLSKLSTNLDYYGFVGSSFISNLGSFENIVNLSRFFGRKERFKDGLLSAIKSGDELLPNVTEQIKYDYHTAYMLSGLIAGAKDNHTKALSELAFSSKLYPFNAEVPLFQAFSHFRNGDLEKGKRKLSESLRLNPDMEDTKYFINKVKSQELIDPQKISDENFYIEFIERIGMDKTAKSKAVNAKSKPVMITPNKKPIGMGRDLVM